MIGTKHCRLRVEGLLQEILCFLCLLHIEVQCTKIVQGAQSDTVGDTQLCLLPVESFLEQILSIGMSIMPRIKGSKCCLNPIEVSAVRYYAFFVAEMLPSVLDTGINMAQQRLPYL